MIESERTIGLRDAGFAALLLLVIGVVYWPVLDTPYVADDWAFLSRFEQRPESSGVFLLLQGSGGRIFSRPLVELYLWGSYQLFGLSSQGYHIAHLGFHFGSSLLVTFLSGRLLRSRPIAWSVGLLYAASAVVLLQPLLWCVGVADLGGAFFVLAAMALYVSNHRIASAIAFVCALGFKESAIVVPLILLGYELCFRDPRIFGARWLRVAMLRLTPHAVCLAVYLLNRGPHAMESFARGDAHPYKLALSAGHLWSHLLTYSAWAFDAIVPLDLPLLGDVRLRGAIVLLVALGGPCALALGRFRGPRSPGAPSMLRARAFLAWWFATGLLLPLMLPNHIYRYYLIYALPAFLSALVALLASLGRRVVRSRQPRAALALLLVAASLVCSGLYVRASLDGPGIWPAAGAGSLPARSRTVSMVRSELLRLYPVLPPRATLVLSGVDVDAFKGRLGVGLWYPDTATTVYRARDVMRDASGLRLRDSWHRALGRPVPDTPSYLDPDTTFVLQARQNRLVEARVRAGARPR